jgi:hypothetical protein
MVSKKEIEQSIKQLNKFDKKVEELKESGFIKWLSENKLSYTLSFNKKKPSEFRYPPKDYIQAFLLMYRFFIYDKDKISIRELNKIYDTLPICDSDKKQFYNLRQALNNFLDSRPFFKIICSEINLKSNRNIVDVLLHGYFAHQNKSEEFEKWMKDEYIGTMILMHFCYILHMVHCIILEIQKINKNTILKLNALLLK